MYVVTRPCDLHERELYAPDEAAIGSLCPASDPTQLKARACAVAGTPGAPGSAAAGAGLLAAVALAALGRRRTPA